MVLSVNLSLAVILSFFLFPHFKKDYYLKGNNLQATWRGQQSTPLVCSVTNIDQDGASKLVYSLNKKGGSSIPHSCLLYRYFV